jgi:N-dimethylarginine dimethylaminohydrolase
MTRAERKAEDKARMARSAVRMLAQLAAKNEVKRQIRAQGLRVHEFTAKEITLRAGAWLAAHPEMIAEARARAAASGYC